MRASTILKRALAKLGPNGEHWIKRSCALDARGKAVWPDDPGATRWCSTGALIAVQQETQRGKACWDMALHHLELEMGGGRRCGSIVQFNDDRRRGFVSIRKAFEAAIAGLKAMKL